MAYYEVKATVRSKLTVLVVADSETDAVRLAEEEWRDIPELAAKGSTPLDFYGASAELSER